ncbi:trypsin-like peptidase domain-containing protein [Martelella alba]|uniref:Trypsin-like peptidase domain-containing protein n=1 Tax=Martelella alba TaxID=2590451 RepID=A0ABY2SK74_9HYPH|nr:trypsin-like peptidase domain-containing protein [Martelella alba]TKI04584.1 trypsin-like peptidase domain-containing protein [Martelella alba]
MKWAIYLLWPAALFSLVACNAVGVTHVDETAYDKADIHFIGVPVLAGAVGSSFPISKKYSLTAAHVARIMLVKVKAYHPLCDVAVIYSDNQHRVLPKLETAVKGEQLSMYGYNAYTAMPTSSYGTLQAFGWWDKPTTSCLVALSNAGGIQGMSGGPVYGADGAVIGVFTATHPARHQSIFIPYQQIAHWVAQQIKS